MAGGTVGPLRAVVIGCGAISDEHLRFLDQSALVELAGVCDLSPTLADLARDRHRALKAYVDVDQMLDDVRPDVVHILSPPRTHVHMVQRSLAVGAHVICEKPLAPSAAETAVLFQLARRSGRSVIETRNLLFNDTVRELDRQLGAGRVGEVREVDVSLSLDLGSTDLPPGGTGLRVGVAHDYLPHLAYLFLHLAGHDAGVDEVVGTVTNLSGRVAVGFDHVDTLVSIGQIRGRLKIAPDVLPSSFRVSVRGTEGSLEADLYQPYVLHEGPPFIGKMAPVGLMTEGVRLILAGTRNARDKLLQHGTYHGMARMLAAVYEAIIEDRPLPVTESSMMASALLIDRIAELTMVNT